MSCRSPGSRKGRTRREPIRVLVESLAFGGDAVARDSDGRVVFVPLAAPGDRVEVRLSEEHKGWARGDLVRVLQPGPARVEPPCPLFGRCGGCQWQHVTYEAQLAAKAAVVAGALRAEVAAGAVLEAPVAAPAALGYRRRARLAVRPGPGGVTVGFRARRSHEVVDVAACALLEPALGRALTALRETLLPQVTRPCALDLVAGHGGDVHAGLDLPNEKPLFDVARKLIESGALGGLSFADTTLGASGVNLSSPEEPALVTSAGDFAQAQHQQNLILQARVAEWARPAGLAVLELYAGAGNLTQALVGAGAARVTAVEESASAVASARAHLLAAPVRMVVGHAEDAVAGGFDVVVLDPPRTGAEAVARAIAVLAPEARPQRIVYVSCDPMTLARDIKRMAPAFQLKRAVAIDMMPQTFHVEVVALLERV